jgi:hypothetical protein
MAVAAEDPGALIPGAVSATILTRGQADRLTAITFD